MGGADTRPLGSILRIERLPDDVVRHSTELAKEFFLSTEAIEFCGGRVEAYVIRCLVSRDGTTWLPNLAELSYRRAEGGYRERCPHCGRPALCSASKGI